MKAMILAAGHGTRMRPLTDNCPKPLLPVVGKPLIVYALERLKAATVEEVVINTAYLGHQIPDALGQGSALGLSLRYSPETEALETAGGILNALPLLGDSPFCLVNGDVWCDFSVIPWVTHSPITEHNDGHLLLVNNPPQHPQGDFSLTESGQLIPPDQKRKTYTYSGIACFHPRLLLDYPNKRRRFALKEVFDWAIARGRLTAEPYSGDWQDIGTPERLQQLEQQLLNNS